jgi:hypothetical protein
MAQGTESALRGNFLLELYPNRLVAPLISYTRVHDVQSKSVISELLPNQSSYLRVSPRLLYSIISSSRKHRDIPPPSNAARFHSSRGGSARSRHPSPFTNHDPISNVNSNAIPRFSGSRSILPLGCLNRPSLVVRLIAAMCFGPLCPREDYYCTTVWTKNGRLT